MARNPIVFQNGTLVSNAKVEVGGTVYDVTPAQYEGTTPLSANNLNQMQTNIYDYVDDEDNKIKGDVVYNNSTGANNNITFTFPSGKSLSDYSKIEIHAKIVFTGYTMNKIEQSEAINGNYISLNIARFHSESTWINDSTVYSLGTTGLTKVYEGDVRFLEGNTVQFNKNTTRTLITKVVLYS